MNLQPGLTLRLLGPLVEVVCMVALLRFRGRSVIILGVSVEQICYLGLIVGFTMVIVGIFLSQSQRERNRRRL